MMISAQNININNQQLTDSKSNIKLDLIKYYDATKSDIDIVAQEQLCNDPNPSNNTQSPSSLENDTLNLNNPIKKKERIFHINKNLINLVEVMFENNIKEIDRYFANIEKEHTNSTTNNNNDTTSNNLNDRENIKLKVLTSYCLFISRDKLKDEFKRLVTLGILIITDWYLDENQINFLR
jgi:hypothetical protein